MRGPPEAASHVERCDDSDMGQDGESGAALIITCLSAALTPQCPKDLVPEKKSVLAKHLYASISETTPSEGIRQDI